MGKQKTLHKVVFRQLLSNLKRYVPLCNMHEHWHNVYGVIPVQHANAKDSLTDQSGSPPSHMTHEDLLEKTKS